jgi:hypothetical protein
VRSKASEEDVQAARRTTIRAALFGEVLEVHVLVERIGGSDEPREPGDEIEAAAEGGREIALFAGGLVEHVGVVPDLAEDQSRTKPDRPELHT